MDAQAGMKLLKKNGSYVKENDIIANIFSSNKNKLSIAKNIINSAFIIKSEKVNSNQLIYNLVLAVPQFYLLNQ